MVPAKSNSMRVVKSDKNYQELFEVNAQNVIKNLSDNFDHLVVLDLLEALSMRGMIIMPPSHGEWTMADIREMVAWTRSARFDAS